MIRTTCSGTAYKDTIEHFEAYPDYLVIALLPEDAATLDEDYQRITDI